MGLVSLLDLWELEIERFVGIHLKIYIEANPSNIFPSNSDRYQAVTVVKMVKVKD